MTIATWGDLLVKKEYKMTMPILQNRYYTLSVAGTMGRNSVVAMLGNYMVIGRLKNNTITFKITDFTAEDTIVLICPEGGSITHAQLERGNKATDWTPAPEDVEAAYAAVKSIADGAATSASDANSLLADIASDSVLTPGEKKSTKKEWDIIVGEKPKIDASADTYSITTQKTAYNNAYNALNTYLTGSGGLLVNLNAKSAIVGTTFRTNFKNYYNARQDLLNAISDGAKSLVDGIEVGGVNLFKNSNFKKGTNGLTDWNVNGTVVKMNIDDRSVVRMTNTSSAGFYTNPTKLIAGAYYTVSFDAKSVSGTASIRIGFLNDSSGKIRSFAVDSVWKRYVFTTTEPLSTNNQLFHFYSNGTSIGTGVYITNVQLEKGNKATDWTPAPEDTQLEIDKSTYNPVRYIRDWANGSTANNSNHWYEIQAIDTLGNNIALGKTVRSNVNSNLFPVLTDGNTAGTFASGGTNLKAYMEVDLGSVYYNISEIKVWRYYNDGRTYYDTKTEVSEDGNNWYPIFDSKIEDEYAETSAGGHPNTQAKSEGLLSAYNTTERLQSATSKVVINGGNITAGRIQDSLKRNNLNLDNGTFEFANGNIKYDGTALKIKTGVEFGALPNDTQTKINAGAQANTLTSAWVQPGTTQINGNNISTGTLSAGKITTGTLSSKNNYSKINLDDGTFSFGNGRLVWNGSDMTVNGKISVSNIDGDIPKSKLASTVQTEISAGTTAKSTLDSKASTWDAKETTSGAQAKANTAEAKAKELANAMAFGKMLYTDPTFKYGQNSVNVYNNSSGTGVTIARIAKQQNAPTDSTHILRVTTSTAETTPGLGGFSFQTMTSANKTYITRFIAKIPSGRSLEFASNAIGSGGNHTTKWLSSNQGTGKWEEYVYKVTAGETGSFSSTNFFYISEGSKPLTWYIAYATVFDVTDDDLIAHKTNTWSYEGTTEINGKSIKTGTLTANQITTGTLKSQNNNSWLNLNNGEFNFANGGLVYSGGNLTLNGKLNVSNLDGDIPKSKLASGVQTEISAGATAKTLTDTWVQPGTTQINGNNISTGTLSAGKITTGILSANNSTSTLNMDTGDMVMNGNFNLGAGALQWNKTSKTLSIKANTLKIGSYDAASKNDVSTLGTEIVNDLKTSGKVVIHGGNIKADTLNVDRITGNTATFISGGVKGLNSNMSLDGGGMTIQDSAGNTASISSTPDFKAIGSDGTAVYMTKGNVDFAADGQQKFKIGTKVKGSQNGILINKNHGWALMRESSTFGGSPAQYHKVAKRTLAAGANATIKHSAVYVWNDSNTRLWMTTDNVKGRTHTVETVGTGTFAGKYKLRHPQSAWGITGWVQAADIVETTDTWRQITTQHYSSSESIITVLKLNGSNLPADTPIANLPELTVGTEVLVKNAVAGNTSGVGSVFEIWSEGSNNIIQFDYIIRHSYDLVKVSDRRLKHDIEESMVKALDHIDSLSFKKYKWNRDGSEEDIGLIAQDSGIIRMQGETEGINTSKAVMLAMKGVQELHEKVKEQAEEIKRLKEIINQ